jgi:hypothetical protein
MCYLCGAMIFSFFKRPSHRKYNYIPRYYNPDEENLKQRLGQHHQEDEDPAESAKNRIRSSFRSKYGGRSEQSRKYVMRSNLIIVITIVLLLVITYIFLIRFLPLIDQALQ